MVLLSCFHSASHGDTVETVMELRGFAKGSSECAWAGALDSLGK